MRSSRGKVSFLSLARFGPGSIAILSALIMLSILLIMTKFDYFAIMVGIATVSIFAVKSVEMLQLGTPEEKKLLGRKCLVVKQVKRNERGVVKVFRDDGSLDPELWSAESMSHEEISENQICRIVGLRSIIALIEPEIV